MNDFDLKIRDIYPGGLLSEDISTLQVNLGRHCNLACNNIEKLNMTQLTGRFISTGPHCFGCTAGAGSSCSGALADILCSS